MPPTRVYNCFINSANRDPNDTANSFKVNFASGEISAKDNEYLTLNILSFSMINSMYNVNQYTSNNLFYLIRTNADGITNAIVTEVNIPNGNYSYSSYMTQINSLCSGIMSLSYNIPQNTYTFKKIDASSYRWFLNPLKCKTMLGVKQLTEITTSGFTGSFINMVNYDKIILRTGNLNLEYYTFENVAVNTNFVENSDIIFWISKTDIEPFRMITYNNEDSGGSYSYKLNNKDVDYIDLRMTNENSEDIKDAPDFLLSLQICVYEKKLDVIENSIIKVVSVLNEIKILILNLLKHIGFFKDI